MAEGDNKVISLSSSYRHKVDAKGRMFLPAKFREELSLDLVVAFDLDYSCLCVWEPADHNAWIDQLFVDKFGGYNSADPDQRAMYEQLYEDTKDVRRDEMGRILLDAEQRADVGIDKSSEVVVVGCGKYFQIWDAQRYAQKKAAARALVKSAFGRP